MMPLARPKCRNQQTLMLSFIQPNIPGVINGNSTPFSHFVTNFGDSPDFPLFFRNNLPLLKFLQSVWPELHVLVNGN
jgi:hypothetical protein